MENMKNNFFKDLLHLHRPTFNVVKLLGTIACMAIILFIGYFSHNMSIASFGFLGIFILMYYENIPLKNLILRFIAVALFILTSFLIGFLTTFASWTAPIAVGLIAFLGRIFFRLYDIKKPGVFFAVLVSAMGASMRIPIKQVPVLGSYYLLGAFIAILMAIIVHFTEKEPPTIVEEKSFFQRVHEDPSVFIDGIFYGATLFLAVYLSSGLQLQNPYWMVVSCAAILQGDNLRAIMQRNVQRILGTVIGIGIAALLLNAPLTTLETIFLIIALFTISQISVRSNYALSAFFTTPMALLLSSLTKDQNVPSLLQYRFIGIALGALLGALSAWLITTGLKFYNKSFDLHESFDKEPD
ncbi:FUSC family protein [Tetragenococcus koreensis]|uniref:FUSC family protein n=1 Tax=Tetragenococcus koreensis TaxID=290335 RepID=UPI0011919B67|nr:FUSC family protein [Tetragenococcus koreensis]GEN91455.1 FUSC family protein [Tetragenococcus koreensis]